MNFRSHLKKFTLRQDLIILAVIGLLSVLMLQICPAVAEGTDGKIYLREGKKALDSGRYPDAVEKLLAAEDSFPLLGDYAALYLAEAFHNLGDHGKSLNALRAMLAKYPHSPLIKRARAAEIREVTENENGDFLAFYESYVKDYPEDEEINLIYGFILKQTGMSERAAAVFKAIYLRAGTFSSSALAELGTADIKTDDLIERALNLIKKYEFREAERDLRKALSMDDGKRLEEILKNLGLALFRQKEYRAAAEVYDRINDRYYKARSLYRAGDRQGFDAALKDLLETQDKRAGYLLVAAASDKRRERDFEGALKIYNEVTVNYPADAEEAMWGIGWTYYVSEDYKRASEMFSKMYSRYEDPKYLYWKARSIEEQREDAGELYDVLKKVENSFYGVLAYARTGRKTSSPVSFTEPVPAPASDRQHRIERVNILLSIGLTREAVAELVCYSKKIDNASEMIYVISRFQELGEFRRAIGLATRIPYSMKMHRFWYPLAYWEDVEKISGKYEMDPFVALSVMREESRFDADARSVAGARGLMQLMPQTAYHLDKSVKLGISRESQINDVKNNISLGAYYLKSLFREFKSLAHVLAAYNAGEIAVRKWEQQGKYKSVDEFIEDIPYVETRNYVKKVMTSYFQYRKAFVSDKAAEGLGLMSGGL